MKRIFCQCLQLPLLLFHRIMSILISLNQCTIECIENKNNNHRHHNPSSFLPSCVEFVLIWEMNESDQSSRYYQRAMSSLVFEGTLTSHYSYSSLLETSVAACTAVAATVNALDKLALLQVWLGNSTNTSGCKIVILELNAAKATKLLIARLHRRKHRKCSRGKGAVDNSKDKDDQSVGLPYLLPLGDEIGIGIALAEQPVVERTWNVLLLVEQIEHVTRALMMDAEDGPHRFGFALALMGIILRCGKGMKGRKGEMGEERKVELSEERREREERVSSTYHPSSFEQTLRGLVGRAQTLLEALTWRSAL